MNYSQLFISAGLLYLVSCGVKTSTELENVSTTSAVDTTINITSFKNPDDIEGCGYYVSSDKETFKKSDFLFVANKEGVGYISVDKGLEKLKLTSTTRNPEKFGDHVDVYINDIYKVTVDIKYKKKTFEEETWTVEGYLVVETKDGRKYGKPIFGERGC